MSFKKDDKVTFVIEDIGTGGEGIGKVDGYTLFVKDAIIGDKIEAKIIKAKKNYGYARLEKIIEASSDSDPCLSCRKTVRWLSDSADELSGTA